jgi:hypothetical protein
VTVPSPSDFIDQKYIGFEVLTAVSMKMAVFWVVAPCSLALIMEAARTSETVVNF